MSGIECPEETSTKRSHRHGNFAQILAINIGIGLRTLTKNRPEEEGEEVRF